MTNSPYPLKIEMDLSQFRQNILAIKKRIKKVKFCLPVKANAYGHGLYEIAQIAQDLKVDYLAVARIEEGISLREEGITLPIMFLSPFFEEEIPFFIQYKIEPTISSLSQLDWLKKFFFTKKIRGKVHLKIDTGMNRIGASYFEAKKILGLLLKEKAFFKLISVYSHLACADVKNNPLNLKQIKLFEIFFHPIKEKYPQILGHLVNSAGFLNFPEAFYDMVRPGLLSYGYLSCTNIIKGFSKKIRPCLSLKSKVCFIKQLKKDQGISYNHDYITDKPTKIAVVPIGYGDGYRFNLSNKAFVLIRGKRFPIVGRICMDLLMINIGKEEIQIGEEVVLIGKQKDQEIKAEELAKILNTHVYEIICGLADRIPLFYR